MDKLVLIGHPGSQHIVPASKYLTGKYLSDFDITYLNHTGPKDNWSNFVLEYLLELDDKMVILSLDDYLVSGYDSKVYKELITHLDDDFHCVKLFRSTPEEHEDYPVTTQFSAWNRETLIELLTQTTNPWNFEMHGSSLWKSKGIKTYYNTIPAIEYNTSSCLSERWQGVDWKGVKPEDKEYILNHKLI